MNTEGQVSFADAAWRKFVREPVLVEAFQLDRREELHTSLGVVQGDTGDWVVRDAILGYLAICPRVVFERTYSPAPDDVARGEVPYGMSKVSVPEHESFLLRTVKGGRESYVPGLVSPDLHMVSGGKSAWRSLDEAIDRGRAQVNAGELARRQRIGPIAVVGEEFAKRREEATRAVEKDQAQQLVDLAKVIYPRVWELLTNGADDENT